MVATLFTNGKIFQSGVKPGTNAGLHRPPTFASCILIRGTQIEHVGHPSDAPITAALAAAGPDTTVVHDLHGKTILPGFVDGHMRMSSRTIYAPLWLSRESDGVICSRIAPKQPKIERNS